MYNNTTDMLYRILVKYLFGGKYYERQISVKLRILLILLCLQFGAAGCDPNS